MRELTVVHDTILAHRYKYNPWISFEELTDKPLYSFISENHKPVEINEIEKPNEDIKSMKLDSVLSPILEKYYETSQLLFS